MCQISSWVCVCSVCRLTAQSGPDSAPLFEVVRWGSSGLHCTLRLCAHTLLGHTGGTVMIEKEALEKLCRRHLDIERPTCTCSHFISSVDDTSVLDVVKERGCPSVPTRAFASSYIGTRRSSQLSSSATSWLEQGTSLRSVSLFSPCGETGSVPASDVGFGTVCSLSTETSRNHRDDLGVAASRHGHRCAIQHSLVRTFPCSWTRCATGALTSCSPAVRRSSRRRCPSSSLFP